MLIFRHPVVYSTVERGLTRPPARAQTARAERNALQEVLLLWERVKACAPPPSLPYKVDTSRPSLRTNWTRFVLQALDYLDCPVRAPRPAP